MEALSRHKSGHCASKTTAMVKHLEKGSYVNDLSIFWIPAQLQFDLVKCQGGVTIACSFALRASIVPLMSQWV